MKDNLPPTLAAAALAFICQAVLATEFYVAPTGNDANPGTKDHPFATLERTRDEIRRLKAAGALTGGVTVQVRGGVYYLERPWLLTAGDSGSDAYPVTYQAAPGEHPILSGGGLSPDGSQTRRDAGRLRPRSTISASCTSMASERRGPGARRPPDSTLAGEDGYTTTAVDMADWKNPGDLEFCYVVVWAHTRCKVQSIKREGDKADHHHAPAALHPCQDQGRREHRKSRRSDLHRERAGTAGRAGRVVSRPCRQRRSITCRGRAKT